MGSPWFLRAVTIYQTVKLGWSPCHPQTVMAKTACSVKRSGSSTTHQKVAKFDGVLPCKVSLQPANKVCVPASIWTILWYAALS